MKALSLCILFFLRSFHIVAHSTIEETSKTCSNDANIKEGHLHMTTLGKTNQEQRCLVKLSRGNSVFLELERYNGRDYDQNAWTNITAVGKPNVTISIGDNVILVGGEKINVFTHSKLEKSMWVRITYLNKYIEFHFAPITENGDGLLSFGHLNTVEHLTSSYLILSLSTTSGMEQVLRSIQTSLPKKAKSISVKTVHEIERRMKSMELEMKKNVAKTEQVLGAQAMTLEKYNALINDYVRKEEVSHGSAVSLLLCAGAVVVVVSGLYWKMKPKNRFRLD
tara:strand:+ start:164 stop:1003 length:840 start_codon:yes stop_codon:yes gene_type:complete